MVNTRCFAASAAATAFVAAFFAAPANADEEKSAAIGFGANGIIGVAENVTTSQDDARAQAVADCTNRGGIRCISIANATNGCVAVAVDASSAIGGIGKSREVAEQMAQSHGGDLKLSTCSIAGGYTGGGAGSYQLDQTPQAAKTAVVVKDTDIYDKPDGNGQRIGTIFAGEEHPLMEPCRDDWCRIGTIELGGFDGLPNGTAWVYSKGYLTFK